jgi:hypothetical protein
MGTGSLLLTPTTAISSESRRGAVWGVAQSFGFGLFIVVFQILLAGLLSGEPDARAAYLKLWGWDGGWYANIVENGYVSPPTLTRESYGNVAFFPAYPVSAALVRQATGWSAQVSLLVTSQIAACGFWTYLLLFFRRWGLAPRLTALGLILLVSHPAAFFLVASYTESLFLLGLLGFIYWSSEGSATGLCLAALHGLLMTSTRLVGLPVVVYPVLHVVLNSSPQIAWWRWRGCVRLLPALASAAVASLGVWLFFLYCQLRFGQWALYFETEEVGWHTTANYLAFFSRRTYWPPPPFLTEGFLSMAWVNQFSVPFTFVVFVALGALECFYRRSRPASGWQFRLPFYVGAALMYYISVCGSSGGGMYSMVRYLLSIEVLLVLPVVYWLSKLDAASLRAAWLRPLCAAWIVLGFLFQLWFTYRFTHGQWVA